MLPKVKLYVNEKIYEGWESLNFRRSISALSATFSLSVSDKWEQNQNPFVIDPFAKCKLELEDKVILNGYFDSVEYSINTTGRSINVGGRDKTCDLIDCSIENSSTLNNLSFAQIAEKLCKPFDVKVIANVSTDTIKTFSVRSGDSVFDKLDEHAKVKGFLLLSDTDGNLIITRAGNDLCSSSIKEGVNVKYASFGVDYQDRFSKYIVSSQDMEGPQEGVHLPVAKFLDANIKRYRPKKIVDGNASTAKDVISKSQWEAKVRAAKSEKLNIQLPTWTQENGDLWDINKLVRVELPSLKVNDTFLITGVGFDMSNSSIGCVLELERKDAYLLDPTIKDKNETMANVVKENS